jgi:2-amino-4-hydroxy-6-hydroxymethyldihydropteridine diphosphokinase
LLSRTQQIERAMGRQRIKIGGPRTIDIDILLYGNFVISTPQLEVPHPRMTARRFVLEPLAAIAPDLRHPGSGKTAREMLAELEGQQVVATSIIL